MIKFPPPLHLFLLLLFCSWLFFVNYNSLSGDTFLAYPITDKIINPSHYSTGDLIVDGGNNGNFLFYKVFSHFPFFKDNLVLRDLLFILPIGLLAFLFWYNIFLYLSKDRDISFLATFATMFVDGKLALNWSFPPFFYLVSAGSVYFIQIFALLCFVKNKYLPSFIILALTSYFHPASSLCLMGVLAIVFFIEKIKSKNYKEICFTTAITILVFLPNYFIIRNNLGGIAITDQYFYILKNFQYHAYLEDHFNSGYVYTFFILGVIFLGNRSGLLDLEEKSKVFKIVVLGLIGSLVWLVNLYFIKNLSVLYLYFITRIFYFLKPLIILLSLVVLKRLYKENGLIVQIATMFVVVSLVFFSPNVSLLLVSPVLFFLLFYNKLHLKNWDIPSFLDRIYKSIGVFRNFVFVSVVLIVLLKLSVMLYSNFSLPDFKDKFNLSFDDNYGYSSINLPYNDLINWSKQYQGKMFIVPPNDTNFIYFRYLTKNSIYTSTDDINQLMYTPPYYYKGYDRLIELGLVIKSRRVWNWDKYDLLNYKDFKGKADFMIFDRKTYRGSLDSSVYKNNEYVVFAI